MKGSELLARLLRLRIQHGAKMDEIEVMVTAGYAQDPWYETQIEVVEVRTIAEQEVLYIGRDLERVLRELDRDG